jgi:hypothetical protein
MLKRIHVRQADKAEIADCMSSIGECFERLDETKMAISFRTEAFEMYRRVYSNKEFNSSGVGAIQRAELKSIVSSLIDLHEQNATLIKDQMAEEKKGEAADKLKLEMKENAEKLNVYKENVESIDMRKVDTNFSQACLIS